MNLLKYVLTPYKIITTTQFFTQVATVCGFTMGYNYIHQNFLQHIKPKARYFIIHTVTNLIIIYFSYECFFEFINDPYNSAFCIEGCKNQIPNLLTTALHLHHLVMYKTKIIDLIHHYPSFVGNLINICYPSGPLQNYTFMFIMGIPGMIDYGLLVLVKYYYINPLTEKKVNSWLNLYIRSPGLIISSFSIFQALMYRNNLFVSFFHKCSAAVICIHNFWNAQYFMEKAIRSEVRASF